MAVREWNEPIVKLLLNKSGIDVNKPDIMGQTPLSMAISTKHVEITKLLLAKGADLIK